MSSVKFTSNLDVCIDKINDKAISFLTESAGELTSETQRLSRVDTGQTKGSYSYAVDKEKGEAYVGSSLENAIWEEFGTGHYALNGDGRKDSWSYQDNFGVWHTTDGKEPNRPLQRAKDNTLDKIKSFAQKLFGEL